MVEQLLTESDSENYDESLIKCTKINKIIPTVCQNIGKLKEMGGNFSVDFDLEVAEQLLTSLNSMELPKTEEEKINYVNEFREQLTSGLLRLGSFFNNLNVIDFSFLSDEQQRDLSQISANLVVSQESINTIASN